LGISLEKIGDPTGKSRDRVALTDEQVKENARIIASKFSKYLIWRK